MIEETEGTNKESVIVGGQECLLSICDKGSEGLEKFLRDRLDSFSGEGLDSIVEVDPTVVLGLLVENLVDRRSTGSNVVAVDKKCPVVVRMTFYIRSFRKRRLVVLANGHFVMWMLARQVNGPQRALPLNLILRMADCLLKDVD